MKRIVIVLSLVLAAGFVFAGGSQEAAAEPDFRIGIVFDVGGRGDNSFNDSAYRGLVMIAEEFGGYIAD
ncbi:MAG: BMP family ABC transporter substrate-binding protein, partial [Spirochaetota bacterium]